MKVLNVQRETKMQAILVRKPSIGRYTRNDCEGNLAEAARQRMSEKQE